MNCKLHIFAMLICACMQASASLVVVPSAGAFGARYLDFHEQMDLDVATGLVFSLSFSTVGTNFPELFDYSANRRSEQSVTSAAPTRPIFAQGPGNTGGVGKFDGAQYVDFGLGDTSLTSGWTLTWCEKRVVAATNQGTVAANEVLEFNSHHGGFAGTEVGTGNSSNVQGATLIYLADFNVSHQAFGTRTNTYVDGLWHFYCARWFVGGTGGSINVDLTNVMVDTSGYTIIYSNTTHLTVGAILNKFITNYDDFANGTYLDNIQIHNHILTTDQEARIYFRAAHTNSPVLAENNRTNLIVEYLFDTPTNSPWTLLDSSPNAFVFIATNSGTLPKQVSIGGSYTNALSLDGINDYIEITNGAINDLILNATNYSVVITFATTDSSYENFLGFYFGPASEWGWYIRLQAANGSTWAAGSIGVRMINGSSAKVLHTGSISLNDGHTNMIAFTHSATQSTFYVNGGDVYYTNDASSYTLMNVTNCHLTIGALPDDSTAGRPFFGFAKGLVDGVRIYNRVLRTNEVHQLWTNSL